MNGLPSETLFESLGDEHPSEWVAMPRQKRMHTECVHQRDCQVFETHVDARAHDFVDTGRPFRVITISSPAAARSSKPDRLVFASSTLTDLV